MAEEDGFAAPSNAGGVDQRDAQMAWMRSQLEEQTRRLQKLEEQLADKPLARPRPQALGAPSSFQGLGEEGADEEQELLLKLANVEEANGAELAPPPSKYGKTSSGRQLESLPLPPSPGGGRRHKDSSREPPAPAAPAMRAQPKEQTNIFDKDLLKTIYEKPYQKARQQGAMLGGGVLGLLSMPFGPIGMAAGGMFGAVCGGTVGYIWDKRRTASQLHKSEMEKRRLKSLVRWAGERFHEDEDVVHLIEMVTLEFKPIADIAASSPSARKVLKLLDNWISRKNVTRNLWVYMDQLLQKWRDLNRGDFMKSMLVFQTLTTMYRYSNRVLGDQEVQFLERMERLLEHASVKLVIAHAQLHPGEGETRVMECMIFADVSRLAGRTRGKENWTLLRGTGDRTPNSPSLHGSASPNSPGIDGEASDDSEDIDTYVDHGTAQGITMAPAASHDAEAAQHEVKKVMVLKKPFFKNWEDFMDFDLTFKHKMPITLSEFDLLLQKEKEDLKGWDVCVDRKEIKVAKIQTSPVLVTLRAWATVPGVDMLAAFFLFHNMETRLKWDKIFAKMEMIDYNVQGSDIMYSLLKPPAVTPRDFLQYRRVRVQDDGSILIVLRSAEHDNCPEEKGYIRAESYSSGYCLREVPQPDGTKLLSIFLMACSDIKGLVPKWLVNYMAPKKPPEWMDTLRDAAIEYQNKNPGFRAVLEEELKKFMVDNPFDFEEVAGPSQPAQVEGAQPSAAPPAHTTTVQPL